jgi:hypothetical protein
MGVTPARAVFLAILIQRAGYALLFTDPDKAPFLPGWVEQGQTTRP